MPIRQWILISRLIKCKILSSCVNTFLFTCTCLVWIFAFFCINEMVKHTCTFCTCQSNHKIGVIVLSNFYMYDVAHIQPHTHVMYFTCTCTQLHCTCLWLMCSLYMMHTWSILKKVQFCMIISFITDLHWQKSLAPFSLPKLIYLLAEFVQVC